MADADHPDKIDGGQPASNKQSSTPYGGHHQIPTIQHYKEIREEREKLDDGGQDDTQEKGHKHDHLKRLFVGENPGKGNESAQGWADQSQNQNLVAASSGDQDIKNESGEHAENGIEEDETQQDQQDEKQTEPQDNDEKPTDTSEAPSTGADPKEKRKAMKGRAPEKDKKSRQVTDPVTHLPVTIHDFTEKEINEAPTNLPSYGSEARTATGISGASKDDDELQEEEEEIQAGYEGMQKLFPPPSFENLKVEIGRAYTNVLIVSLLILSLTFTAGSALGFWLFQNWSSFSNVSRAFSCVVTVLTLLMSAGLVFLCKGWLASKVNSIWQDETWDAARLQEKKQQRQVQIPESAMWLNSVLASIWPLVNPDLFNSLVDTLEDVMQASLPKVVRMIAIDDFGQGKSPLRILGVQWLPSGAASRSVSKDGKLKKANKGNSDRDVPDQGQVDASESEGDDHEQQDSKGKEDEDINLSEGMEAESGDFMNMELSFSYRASSKGKSLKKRTENAHLYLVFYLPAGIPLPVWVAVDGIVGTARLRIQTAPDPPFINLCTLSFMGQPKASISCVPLVKRGPNLMDIPLLSSFVQSSVDAALAEYVAPKSLTLDLKQMLKGDDFKKDTAARGVLLVKVHWADGMEAGDTTIPLVKNGSSDCYVSAGWAKFSKPMWSTRIIISDMHPSFEEHCFLLVGPEELNAQERLRLQLWDSDRTSADDDLGRIEVDLNELMTNENSKSKMWSREDDFVGLDGKSSKPGKLCWEVGYFDKLGVTQDQLKKQTISEVESVQELKDKVTESTKRKLREAPRHIREEEASQQRAQEYYEQQSELICAAPPPDGFECGILSIQVHNAIDLEIAALQKKTKSAEEESENIEDDLPSPYCNIIINGKIVFKTRTKPKNSNPFFNAACERFIRDWRETEVIVAVRDSRVHENDSLLGIVHLPLERLLQNRSQTNDTYPIAGGAGFGRLRVSMIFRSTDLKLPKELRGWDYGTIEIGEKISSSGVPEDLQSLRLKLHTTISKAKMKSNKDSTWSQKRDRKIHLAVTKRYSTSLVIEFRSDRALKDKTAAYAILWLKDISDDTDASLELPVWRGSESNFKRAQANVLEEMGERAGSIKIQLKLFAGLSDYHKKLKDTKVRDVLECLDAASDNRDIQNNVDDDGGSTSENSEDGTSADEGSLKGGSDDRKGPIDALKDYKDKSKTLHRQHKGLMQWRVARTGDWIHTKIKDDIGGKVKDAFSRKGKVQGVETEV